MRLAVSVLLTLFFLVLVANANRKRLGRSRTKCERKCGTKPKCRSSLLCKPKKLQHKKCMKKCEKGLIISEEIREIEEQYKIKFTDSQIEEYKDTKRPKKEGEVCGGCECFPIQHKGYCEEGLACIYPKKGRTIQGFGEMVYEGPGTCLPKRLTGLWIEACDSNEKFAECGSDCPRTCQNRGQNIACKDRCKIAACVCREGYILSREGGECIKEENCEKLAWRPDGRCGTNFPAPSGEPGQCDPEANANEKGPCCSPLGWCGNSAAHCDCPTCIDYSTEAASSEE